MGKEATDIDPAMALELLPQKIMERKRVITALALDLSIVVESEFGSEAERDQLVKQIAAQKNFLALYEARLESIHKAAAGG